MIVIQNYHRIIFECGFLDIKRKDALEKKSKYQFFLIILKENRLFLVHFEIYKIIFEYVYMTIK